MTQAPTSTPASTARSRRSAPYLAWILRDDGAACDVVAARDAVDLEGYDLIVLGTGLYMGRPPATRGASCTTTTRRWRTSRSPSSPSARSATSLRRRTRCGRSSSARSSATPSSSP